MNGTQLPLHESRPRCPYLVTFTPGGRSHCYELCSATAAEPIVPSADELACLCHAEFQRCSLFVAARAGGTVPRAA